MTLKQFDTNKQEPELVWTWSCANLQQQHVWDGSSSFKHRAASFLTNWVPEIETWSNQLLIKVKTSRDLDFEGLLDFHLHIELISFNFYNSETQDKAFQFSDDYLLLKEIFKK